MRIPRGRVRALTAHFVGKFAFLSPLRDPLVVRLPYGAAWKFLQELFEKEKGGAGCVGLLFFGPNGAGRCCIITAALSWRLEGPFRMYRDHDGTREARVANSEIVCPWRTVQFFDYVHTTGRANRVIARAIFCSMLDGRALVNTISGRLGRESVPNPCARSPIEVELFRGVFVSVPRLPDLVECMTF